MVALAVAVMVEVLAVAMVVMDARLPCIAAATVVVGAAVVAAIAKMLAVCFFFLTLLCLSM